MKNSPIHGHQNIQPFFDHAVSAERRVSPAEVAADYMKFNEVASQLKIMQDLLKDASDLGLSQEFIASLNKDFMKTGAEMALIQSVLNEQNNKEIRKQAAKSFQEHLEKMTPQSLTTAPELAPIDNSIINKMPFQSAFAYILLDKYIPAQEKALFALGRELNLSGYAQSTFSPLLEAIKGFNSAPIVYNLGSYLSLTSGTSNFKYGYYLILDRFEEECNQINEDLRSIEKAQKVLKKILKDIQVNSSLTPEQKAQLTEMAYSYQDELNALVPQINQLSQSLRGLIFIPGGSEYEPSYEVIGSNISILQIHELEKVVVNGDMDIKTGKAKGGLLNIFNKCLADIQNYSDLAQTTQLMLELQLRAMQQEWSLVAASLRTMHNVYRTLISSLI